MSTLSKSALTGACTAVLIAVAACGSGAPAQDAKEAPQGGPPPMPAPVTLSSRPDAGPGEKLFIEKCVMCHGPNGMGTGLLARRMDVALLEEREDLPADYVIQAARMGIGNMPAIPRGEVSDADMQAIADYLASKTPKDMGGTLEGAAR